MQIVEKYVCWAKNEVTPKVVIVYETMWGSTEKMARRIADGITDSGVSAKIFDVSTSDRTEIIKEMLDTKGFLFGSSTHDNNMLPTMAGFLDFVKGMLAKNRVAAGFGSYGWAGGAVKQIEGLIKESGITVAQEGLSVKYVPDAGEIKQCYEFGRDFARMVKGGG